MKQVICISAKAQHGKDTTATILKAALEGRGEVRVLHLLPQVLYLYHKTSFHKSAEISADFFLVD